MNTNEVIEKLNSPIVCENLIRDPHSEKFYCRYLTNKIGRLYPVNKPMCNLICAQSGPHNGKKISKLQEQEFLEISWKRYSPMLSDALVEKLLVNYNLHPVQIHIPEEYNSIYENLKFLEKYNGFKGILLTGSVIVKNLSKPPKDYDIALWFDNIDQYLKDKILEKLPPKINNIPVDYFICIGNEESIPNLYFVCLDPLNKKLYLSNWFRLNIESVEDGITIVPTSYEHFDEILKQKMLGTWKNIHSKILWKKTRPSWENAEKFLMSAKSRGIISTIGDILNISNEGGERVDDSIYSQRRDSCFGNGIEPPCQLLQATENNHFCGGCGCGANRIAKLDIDKQSGYSKLHYPYLECPLKRKGFSNYRIPLSIVIPALNDAEEVNLTIQSIYQTCPSDVDIIVVDDGSDVPLKIEDSRVRLFRFDERRGAGQSRHFGAINSKSKHLLFIDSHMRFDDGWFENAMQRIEDSPKTLWCGACLGLDSKNMNVKTPYGVYTGADLVLYKKENNTIFDGVWRPDFVGHDDYEISCIMGACYFIHKEWYFYIKGLEQTMMWGSEEPILSTKTWLAGGEVRLMKSVRIGHKFRSASPYVTNISHIHYNKIAYMYMLFPNSLYLKLLSKFANDGNKMAAINLLTQNKEKLDKEREYYQSIFKYDINWLCEKFNITIPS